MNKSELNVFDPDVLLVFIGHSGDAKDEAEAVRNLQHKLQGELDRFINVSGTSIAFRRVRCWEWNYDALPGVGGQDSMITPAVDRANIAVFVFKWRVGPVTWEELNRSTKRTNPPIPVIAAFTEIQPKNLLQLSDVESWMDLLKKKQSLSSGWTAPESSAIKPITTYTNCADLGLIVFEQLKLALDTVLRNHTNIGSASSNTQHGSLIVGDYPQLRFDQRPVLHRVIADLDQNRVDDFLSKPLARESVEGVYSGGDPPQREDSPCSIGTCPRWNATAGAMLCFGNPRLLRGSFDCCGLQLVVYTREKRSGSNPDISRYEDNLLHLFDDATKWLATRSGLGAAALSAVVAATTRRFPRSFFARHWLTPWCTESSKISTSVSNLTALRFIPTGSRLLVMGFSLSGFHWIS